MRLYVGLTDLASPLNGLLGAPILLRFCSDSVPILSRFWPDSDLLGSAHARPRITILSACHRLSRAGGSAGIRACSSSTSRKSRSLSARSSLISSSLAAQAWHRSCVATASLYIALSPSSLATVWLKSLKATPERHSHTARSTIAHAPSSSRIRLSLPRRTLPRSTGAKARKSRRA
jgi:hypothetical protein